MPLTLYRRGKVWHYSGTVAGKRLRRSTKTEDKARAQRIAAEREARHWKGHLDGPAAVLTFAQVAILYRETGKPARYLEAIEDYWKNTPVKDITAGAVKQSAMRLFPKVSGATRNRYVIVPTQAIINHAAEAELCPLLRVKRFPVVKRERKHATWQWIEAFMEVASPHLGALACFMFLTGARISEALSVRWRDVDLSAGRALIRQTKVGSERRAHLPAVLVAAIANIEGERDPDAKVFRYSSYHTAKPVWNAAIRRAGIAPLTFHACRHGFATSMLQAGVDPVTVAKLGGWASPALVFSTYGHAAEDDTAADRIADNLTQTTGTNASNRLKSTG